MLFVGHLRGLKYLVIGALSERLFGMFKRYSVYCVHTIPLDLALCFYTQLYATHICTIYVWPI